MLPKALRLLWGDLTNSEIKKFSLLSFIIMLLLGNYWMLKSTKNALFNALVGYREWLPTVKIISLIIMVFMVLIYSKLIDLFEQDKLFFIICGFYGISFFITGYFLINPTLFKTTHNSSFYYLISWIPGKFIGWFSYLLLESYGSILVALFYSFVANVITTESAKKGYGMMAFITQIGTIGGSVFTSVYSEKLGIGNLFLIGSFVVLLIPFLIKFYILKIPTEKVPEKQINLIKKKNTGFWEGLKILFTKPYVAGVFVIATFYETIATITEYQMNCIATQVYITPESLASFNANLSIGINTLALIFALIGTSFFMRKFGLKFCLMSFPITIGIVVLTLSLFKILTISDYNFMWALFGAMISFKGLQYALNKPSIEVVYIPTSKDIKFKSKGWIETFGSRSTKSFGASISNSLKHSLVKLNFYGNIISIGLVIFWTFVAASVGKTFKKLQETNETIE